MKHQWPIEKHAAALGVPGVKVTFATFNGPDATNDALLSGAVDIVSGGPPGLLDGALIQQILDDPPNIDSVTPLASTKWTGFSVMGRAQQGECRVVEGFVLARDLGLAGELKRDFWARRVGNFRRC